MATAWNGIELNAIRGATTLLLALGVVSLVAWLLYRRWGPVWPRTQPMAYLEHLEELRRRLVRTAIIVALWATAFLTLHLRPFRAGPVSLYEPVFTMYNSASAAVYTWIVRTAVPPGVQVIVSTPTEAVAAQMGLAFLLALIVSLPVIAFEVWAFLAPGMGSRERRWLARSLPAALLLFLSGAAFAYALVVPLMLRVLYAFAAPLGALPLLSAGSLVGMVATLCVLFGAAFELPLVMVAFVRVGLTTPQSYLRRWRHATLIIFIVAAVASDPTLLSQLIIGLILLALYWGGVAASFYARPPLPILRPTRYTKVS